MKIEISHLEGDERSVEKGIEWKVIVLEKQEIKITMNEVVG